MTLNLQTHLNAWGQGSLNSTTFKSTGAGVRRSMNTGALAEGLESATVDFLHLLIATDAKAK